MPDAVLALSGGLDSATLLADALAGGRAVECVGFIYGSKHNPHERAAARAVADHYGVPYRVVDLTEAFSGLPGALMAGQGPVPEGHYEAESMRQTVVPARNIIFAAVLAGVAWGVGARDLYLGVHAGDHYIYPDCRPQFVSDMRNALHSGTDGRVRLLAPFLHMDKAAIVLRGLALGVPYGLTRTCYTDGETACGRCGSCQERLAAFIANGWEDPLPYAARAILAKEPGVKS